MIGALGEMTGYKHGRHNTKEYRSWRGMLNRCYNANTDSYPNYGGRGIRVCDAWRDVFENFFADMGEAPSQQHSIDRIDNNGDYQPSNCRWATKKEQIDNRRLLKTKFMVGEQSLKRYCEHHQLPYKTIWNRVSRLGWSMEDALSKPSRNSR